jgi:hypothetical protein
MPTKLPLGLSIVAVVFKGRADLIVENMALRHQLACLSGDEFSISTQGPDASWAR